MKKKSNLHSGAQLLLRGVQLIPDPGVLLAQTTHLGLVLLLLRFQVLEMRCQRHHHLAK